VWSYLTSFVLLVVGAFVWYYNSSHGGTSYLMLPLLDRVPALENDVHAQAQWSWRVVVGLGVCWLFFSFVTGRGRSAPHNDDD
jgi:hypothetical protein